MNRRSFMASILVLGAAPAIVRAASLMKVVTPSGLVIPTNGLIVTHGGIVAPDIMIAKPSTTYVVYAFKCGGGNGSQEFTLVKSRYASWFSED